MARDDGRYSNALELALDIWGDDDNVEFGTALRIATRAYGIASLQEFTDWAERELGCK